MTRRAGLRASALGAAGFSTMSMIVSFMLLGFLLSPLLGTIVTAQRGFVDSRERARAAGNVRYAHLALTRFMRIAGSSPRGVPVRGIDPDPNGNGVFDDVRLRADYNPADGDTSDPGEDLVFFLRADTMFVRAGFSDQAEPYLIGVDSLAFDYFDRDGRPITDKGRIADRAMAVQVVIRARGEPLVNATPHLLRGEVRLRNSRG